MKDVFFHSPAIDFVAYWGDRVGESVLGSPKTTCLKETTGSGDENGILVFNTSLARAMRKTKDELKTEGKTKTLFLRQNNNVSGEDVARTEGIQRGLSRPGMSYKTLFSILCLFER